MFFRLPSRSTVNVDSRKRAKLKEAVVALKQLVQAHRALEPSKCHEIDVCLNFHVFGRVLIEFQAFLVRNRVCFDGM